MSEVRDFIEANSPWLPSNRKKEIIRDWENYIAETEVEPQLEEIREQIGEKTPSFWERVKKFLGRLFR
ncbi:MAG: hypothetical protein ACFFHV_20300 [Promethearchaeota archaeon]